MPPVSQPPTPSALALLVHRVAPLLHSDQKTQAAQLAADHFLPESVKITNQADANTVLQTLVYKCLHTGQLASAAELLWPPSFFTSDPRSVQRIWRNMEEHSGVLLMGASSMSKTYTPGVWFLLEWYRDPEYTNVVCVGPSEEHLEANLFSHLVKLHTNASIPMPGKIGKRWLGLDTRNKRAGIRGVVIPVGKGAAGRLQGTKRHPRPVFSPQFGNMSRLFLLLDELENVPPGVYSDIENVFSNAGGDYPGGFKIVCAYNPKDVTKRPYKMSEPPDGWENFDPEAHEEWTSKLDWRVVRLDAKTSENVVEDKIIFPGLQTKSGYDKTIKASGGVGTPGYWTFARGCYPPQGSSSSAIPAHLFDMRRGEVVFIERPAGAAGADMALEGGDSIPYGHGYFGKASGVTQNKVFKPFLDTHGKPSHRYVLQFLTIYPLARGDTLAVAALVKGMTQTLGVRPAALMLDRTGNGAGVHDVLKSPLMLGPDVRGVNYSQSPTAMKVMREDTETAEQRFPRIDSELIFALRDWLEHGYLWFHPDFDITTVRDQLSSRQAFQERGKQRVQSKSDYKANHGGKSPDESDTLALTVHAVRVNFSPDVSVMPEAGVSPNDEGDFAPGFTDVSNRIDDIDSD